MKSLHKLYILREFFAAFPIVGIGLSCILSLINLIDKLDDFMKGEAALTDLILYASLHIPKNLFYLLPMSILICSLFVFTKAVKHNEIVIIKASGGRIKSLLAPFILVGLMLSAFGFFLGEFIIPATNKKAEELKIILSSQKQSGVAALSQPFLRKKTSLSEGTLWLKDNKGAIVRIGLYSYENNAANDIRIFIMNNNVFTEQIEAEKALWDGQTWKLINVKDFVFKTGQIVKIKEVPYPALDSPEFFSNWVKKPDEMSVAELVRYIKRLRGSGYSNPKLLVDLNSRLSYPLVNLFMLIIGISLPLRGRAMRGLIASGIGLLISLVYWGGYILSMSLGNAGILPPVLAPWTMPVIFALVSAELFRRIPE